MRKTVKAQNLHPKNVGFPNLPTCEKQQKLKTYIPKRLAFQIFQHAKNSKSSKATSLKPWLSKSSNMPKTATAQNLHPKSVGFPNLPTCENQQKLKSYIPKTLAFQIFQHAKNSKSSKPTSQKRWLSKSSHMRQTAKAQNLHPKNVGFPNLPTCQKQQKLKTYIPKTLAFQIFPHATNSKSSKHTSQKRWLSKSSNMPKTAKAQNPHPKNVGFPNLPTCQKQQKLKTYIPKTLAFQIFPHATNSKSSKPTSQKRWRSKSSHMRKSAKAQNLHPKNVGFPNLPTCQKQQKLKTYIPRTLAFQIFPHAKISKSSKPTSQKRWLSKSSNMPKTAKAQNLHPKNVGFPNLPTCDKQQKLKTYIPKTLAFQIFPHATNSKSSKATSQKRWLSTSSNMPKTAKAQNLHPKNVGFPNLPTCEKQQKLKTYIPKTLAFQIFPHAKISKSSKPTSQKRWLCKSSNMPKTAKAQKLHPKKRLLSKFSHMRKTAKAQNLHPKNVGFPNLTTCEKQQKLKTYLPKTLAFQIFQHAKTCKTTAKAQNLHPKNVGFPNLPTCDKQQKLKSYIPKTLAFQIFQHAKNSKSSKPTSQKRWLSKSSHMRQTAKAQNLHPKNVGFPHLPTCEKQQKLKTYIPKTLAFQIFPHATNSKSSKATSQKRWLSTSSNMPKTAKAQNLHPKNVGFPNLPTCDKQQKLKTYIPKTLAFQIFQHAKNSKSSKPTSHKRWLSKSSNMPKTAKAQKLHPKNVCFPNLPTCQKQQKLKTYIPKTLALQIFPHAKNSKSSNLHPKNVGFPNLPTCDKQQKLKTYIPKTLAFQIFQHAKNSKSSKPTSQKRWLSKIFPHATNSKSSKPTSQKRWLSKSSNMPKHAKQQQKLKTYIPKTLAFQIFPHATNSKSSKPTSQKRWLSKSSNMPKHAKQQQKLKTYIPKTLAFQNLPTCDKQQKLKTYIPKTLAFQIFQHAKNSKTSKPTSQKRWLSKSSNMPKTAKAQNLHPKNVGFPNLPTCDKQQKLKTYIPKTLSQVPPEASKNSPGPWGCWKALEALKPSKTSPSWKLTWKPKRGSIKTTVPLRWGYMGFHVSLGECREVLVSLVPATVIWWRRSYNSTLSRAWLGCVGLVDMIYPNNERESDGMGNEQ